MKTEIARDIALQYRKDALLEIAQSAAGHADLIKSMIETPMGLAAKMDFIHDADDFRMLAYYAARIAAHAHEPAPRIKLEGRIGGWQD